MISKPIDSVGVDFDGGGHSALQLFLDRGNTVGWDESGSISWLMAIFVLSLTAFVWRSHKVAAPG